MRNLNFIAGWLSRTRPASVCLLFAVVFAGWATAADDHGAVTPDEDMLEFLGGWEGEERQWMELLALPDWLPVERARDEKDGMQQDH